MRDINRVMLLGRLGNDPVVRQTKNGVPVANFSLATEFWNRTKNEGETTWHRVVAWGRPAELAEQELKKGMPLLVEGGIRVRKYEDEEGEVHYLHEVHAEQLHFLHAKIKSEKPQDSLVPEESNSTAITAAEV
jgi:single-strand DNA-binding protein